MKCGYHSASCAKELKPMLDAFFNKAMSAVEWNCEDNDALFRYIQNIAEVAQYLAENTRNYQRLKKEEIEVLHKIFGELDALLEEARKHDYSQFSYKDDLNLKISCISEIIYKNQVGISEEDHENWRDGMIFQDYESLWKVIYRINREWDELRSRGFSLEVFNDFYTAFNYDRSRGEEMSEDGKINTFMALLDGEMKFVPVYRKTYSMIGLKVVDRKAGNKIVLISKLKLHKPHCMRQVPKENLRSTTGNS